jgi:hypothetical protein
MIRSPNKRTALLIDIITSAHTPLGGGGTGLEAKVTNTKLSKRKRVANAKKAAGVRWAKR